MRLLFINRRLSDRSGADRWLLGVLTRLQSTATTLLAIGFEDIVESELEHARIGTVERIKGLDRGGPGRPASPTVISRLEACIEGFIPDAIVVNDIVDPGLLAAVAATGRGIAMVQDHRSFCPGRGKLDREGRPCGDAMGEGCARCFDDSGYAQTLLALTRRRLEALKGMSRVLVLSHYMAAELALVGVDSARITVVPPFIDRLEVASEPAAVRTDGYHLLIGRLAFHKGIDVALDAARSLSIRCPLVVAGDGPLADTVASASEEYPSQIRYAGWADRARIAELLREARTLWLPSLWAEPFGIVGLEAMAAGVPVISADVGGVRDWLDPEVTGLLVPPGDAVALAEAADHLAAEPTLAQRLGENGRKQLLERFVPERLMKKLSDVLSAVAAA